MDLNQQKKNTIFGYSTLCMNSEDVDYLIGLINKNNNISIDNNLKYMKSLAKISSFNCRPYINKYIEKEEREEASKKDKEKVREREEASKREKALLHTNILNNKSSPEVLSEIYNNNLEYLMESNTDNKAIYKEISNDKSTGDLDESKTLKDIFADLNLLKYENIGRVIKIQYDISYGNEDKNNGKTNYKYIYIKKNNEDYILIRIDIIKNGNCENNKIIWNRFKKIYISVNKFDIEQITEVDFKSIETAGGYKKSSKFKTKEVLGKLRRVYRIPNSKKEHIKHKGKLITVSEYKILMKLKNKR
jgi:hypothetical protein